MSLRELQCYRGKNGLTVGNMMTDILYVVNNTMILSFCEWMFVRPKECKLHVWLHHCDKKTKDSRLCLVCIHKKVDSSFLSVMQYLSTKIIHREPR